MNFETARKRSAVTGGIRNFFNRRGYLEVETPVLSPGLIPESPIEIFETQLRDENLGNRPLYLVPSPEVHMKKLLAAGSGNIFQICKSFRNLEQAGKHHNPEFTMLEWYTVEADYHDSIETTAELFTELAERFRCPHIAPPFRRMSIHEIFREYAGIDLELTASAAQLMEACNRLKLLHTPPAGPVCWEEIYHRVFLTHIEPRLPVDRPLILSDYPRQIPCLARDIPGTPWKERWELYISGIEIANCYSEETDPVKVEQFCMRENARKAALSSVVPDVDRDFLEIFRQGYPKSSGAALGVDRLVMAITGEASIGGVIFFPISDIVGR